MQSTETSTIVLPEGTNLYSHQVAGHEYDGKSKLGVLKHNNGSIIKPIKEDDRRAERELLFYETVFSSKEADPVLNELANFLPKFLGTCQIKMEDKELKFLCLEDVCKEFTTPSILDIKIGKKTYDPEASKAKMEYEKSKYLYNEVLGFRILGMKVYCNDKNIYMSKDKKFGKQVTPEDMKSVLELLLTNNLEINCAILCGFLHKLTELLDWFKRQRKFAFYSSSLLFVYEGTLSLWYKWIANNFCTPCGVKSYNEDSSASITTCLKNVLCETALQDMQCQTCLLHKNLCHKIKFDSSLIRLVVIDCAHVFPASEEDSNYIFGLESLIYHFKLVLNNQKILLVEKNTMFA